MPRSAVNTGLVDFVMPPEEMGIQLQRYVSHMDLVNLRAKQNTEETNEDLRHIFGLVNREFGVDFSKYKLSDLLRRLGKKI
jgi:two-component system CheB/CheR fusion protein